MPDRIAELAHEYASKLPPDQLNTLIRKVRAKAARLRTTNDCPEPLALAEKLNPEHTVRTPALSLLAERLVQTVRTRDGRLIISVPPQSGKSTLLRWMCLWMLADNPDRRITFVSYEHGLARDSGRTVRILIDTYGDELGLAVSRDHFDASSWQLEGHLGGMFSTGVGGALTGRPSDVMLVDDALRGEADANSDVIRRRLHTWWESTARTRMAPGAPIIVVGTRWHPDDLSGRLAADDWPVLNIPALADGKVPDALERPVGTWLE